MLLENDSVALWVTQSVGPRVIGFALRGESNVFAELTGLALESSGREPYFLRGGHRLWHAPENPGRTYVPDDAPVRITSAGEGSVRVIQPVESHTGIQKSLLVTVPCTGARAFVEHTLHNRGPWPIQLSPWAITMFPLDGVALLPLQVEGGSGVLPSQQLVLWPYTRLTDARLRIGECLLMVAGNPGPRFKVGFANHAGWLAYWQEGILFVKQVPYSGGQTYPDRGSSSECYVGDCFLELETLGPLQTVMPGESVSHTEQWQLLETDSRRPEDEASAVDLLRSAKLLPNQGGT